MGKYHTQGYITHQVISKYYKNIYYANEITVEMCPNFHTTANIRHNKC